MFRCILSVLICLVVTNSSARHEKFKAIESRVTRDRYSVPQEIRDKVPVDFAAMNLRKSRLKNQIDRNILRHRPDVDKGLKASINEPKRINAIRNSTKQSKYGEKKGQARKRPVDNKFLGSKKLSRFRMDSFQSKSSTTTREIPTVSPKKIPIELTNFNKNVRLQSRKAIQPSDSQKTSELVFEKIKKAINALPQQMVKIVRDDVDCNDDPQWDLQNTRGPPCSFSLRSSRIGGHPAFWLTNVTSQNWDLFY